MNTTGSSAKMSAIKQEYASQIPAKKTEEVKKEVKKTNPWMDHVKAFRATHPGLSFKDVLKQAKTTYKKA